MESYSDTNMSSTNSQPSSLKSIGGASLDVGFVEYIVNRAVAEALAGVHTPTDSWGFLVIPSDSY